MQAPGVQLEGRLVDARGAAVSARFLQAIPEGDTPASGSWARPSEDGTFSIRGLAPGRVVLRVWVDDERRECGTFTAPGSDVVVVVPDE